MKSKTLLSLGLCLAAGSALALDVSISFKARHDYFHEMGSSMKAIRQQLSSPSPDMTVIRKLTALIDLDAPKLASYFPEGTGPSAGKTEARAEIWTRAEDFKKASADFTTAAHGLNTAANSDDLKAVQAAFTATGQTCKSCHQSFRQEDH